MKLRSLGLVASALALAGLACAPRPVMQPRVARVSLGEAAPSPSMEQSCAGELCFPYETDR